MTDMHDEVVEAVVEPTTETPIAVIASSGLTTAGKRAA